MCSGAARVCKAIETASIDVLQDEFAVVGLVARMAETTVLLWHAWRQVALPMPALLTLGLTC